MRTYSMVPNLNPSVADDFPKTRKVDHASLQGKSVELAGSGVTSIFPSRLETNVGNKRGPNWLAGFLYWLRRKEKGKTRLAGLHCHCVQVQVLVLPWLRHRIASLAAAQCGPCNPQFASLQAHMLTSTSYPSTQSWLFHTMSVLQFMSCIHCV